MGQYFTPILFPVGSLPKEMVDTTSEIITPDVLESIENKTYLTFNPFNFENGLKLTESAWIGNVYINAVLSHLFEKPMKVAWIGDYSNDVHFSKKEDVVSEDEQPNPEYGIYSCRTTEEKFAKVYEATHQEVLNSREVYGTDVNTLLDHQTKGMYLINHSQKLYIDLAQYIEDNDEEGWCMNPLSLLTACGNGQGGGDYYGSNHDLIGEWAFEILEYSAKIPENYENTKIYFSEIQKDS